MKEYSNFLERIDGELYFDGCALSEVAETYGTPLYVLSASTLKETLTEIKTEFIDKYENVLPLYASKALSIKYVYEQVEAHGFGVDVVSAGEIFVALKSGVNPNHIYFHGSNKGADEIAYAIDHGVTHFVIDNFHEIELINKICTEKETPVLGMLRIVPQVEAGGHKYIKTGQVDTKFGFSTHDETYHKAIELVINSPYIHFIGLHCHIGSQVESKAPFIATAKVMMQYVISVKEKFGITIPQLNIGGGYGIVYESGSNHLTFTEIIHDVMTEINQACATANIERPKILIEPGRSIVGNAGITLYTIGSTKNIPDVCKYVSVDGGMTDNIRPALYQAKYNAFLVNDSARTKAECVTIVGKCCESGDKLIYDITLPHLQSGDFLAVTSTGAYNYSMSSNYNQLCRPGIVVVDNGEHRLIIRRQTFEDLINCEVDWT